MQTNSNLCFTLALILNVTRAPARLGPLPGERESAFMSPVYFSIFAAVADSGLFAERQTTTDELDGTAFPYEKKHDFQRVKK